MTAVEEDLLWNCNERDSTPVISPTEGNVSTALIEILLIDQVLVEFDGLCIQVGSYDFIFAIQGSLKVSLFCDILLIDTLFVIAVHHQRTAVDESNQKCDAAKGDKDSAELFPVISLDEEGDSTGHEGDADDNPKNDSRKHSLILLLLFY